MEEIYLEFLPSFGWFPHHSPFGGWDWNFTLHAAVCRCWHLSFDRRRRRAGDLLAIDSTLVAHILLCRRSPVARRRRQLAKGEQLADQSPELYLQDPHQFGWPYRAQPWPEEASRRDRAVPGRSPVSRQTYQPNSEQCQRSALSVFFNIGAIGTGLIIGSSTALVRGTATKRNGVIVHRTEFSRRTCWLAHRLCHSWYANGLTNLTITDVVPGVDWYERNIALATHLELMLPKAGAL